MHPSWCPRSREVVAIDQRVYRAFMSRWTFEDSQRLDAVSRAHICESCWFVEALKESRYDTALAGAARKLRESWSATPVSHSADSRGLVHQRGGEPLVMSDEWCGELETV